MPHTQQTRPKTSTHQANMYCNKVISFFKSTIAAATGKTILTKQEQNAPIKPTTLAKNGRETAAATQHADKKTRITIEPILYRHAFVSELDPKIVSSTINATGFIVKPNFVMGLMTINTVAILATVLTRSLALTSFVIFNVISLAVFVPYIKYPNAATEP